MLGTVLPLQEFIDNIRDITYNTYFPLGGPGSRLIRIISTSI